MFHRDETKEFFDKKKIIHEVLFVPLKGLFDFFSLKFAKWMFPVFEL